MAMHDDDYTPPPRLCYLCVFYWPGGRCIDGTCLETPVKFVAEECAVPMYECIGNTCCRCFCSNGASENVDNAREVGSPN